MAETPAAAPTGRIHEGMMVLLSRITGKSMLELYKHISEGWTPPLEGEVKTVVLRRNGKGVWEREDPTGEDEAAMASAS